ncbi:MAG: FliM/FliN family flagellar motor C-terminal domain-containing protein [Pseudomonadota bacterium]
MDRLNISSLKSINVPIRFVIGEKSMKIRDFLEIKSGELLNFRDKWDNSIKIYVGDACIGSGELVAQEDADEDRVAIKITAISHENLVD